MFELGIECGQMESKLEGALYFAKIENHIFEVLIKSERMLYSTNM